MILMHPRAPLIAGAASVCLFGAYLAIYHPSPGALASPHARAEGRTVLAACQDCHSSEGLTSGCLDCHTEIAQQLRDGRGYHHHVLAGRDTACAPCHPEHLGGGFHLVNAASWQGANPDAFDHSHVEFRLTGKHEGLECAKCHAEKLEKPFALPRFETMPRDVTCLGLTQECISCHEDIHAGGLAPACETCHGQETFRPAAFFDHDEHFVLEGAHSKADCKGCHIIPEAEAGSEKPLLPFDKVRGNRCADCHDDVHGDGITDECGSCHAQEKFDPAELFDHDARYVLEGAHASTECSGCHDKIHREEGEKPFLPFDLVAGKECTDCHPTPHRATLAERCEECHPGAVDPWTHAREEFTAERHEKTGFPLTEPHSKVECEKCHSAEKPYEARFPDPSAPGYLRTLETCRGCHEDPHGGQFAAGHERCRECHAKTHFLPSNIDQKRHAEHFPLLGSHQAVACVLCHPKDEATGVRRFTGTARSCKKCHHDPHGRQFDKELAASDCTVCHRDDSETFRIRPFDHEKKTGYPLEGGHAKADCTDCHRVVSADLTPAGFEPFRVYRGTSRLCAGCHRDVHCRQFVQEGENRCERCHASTARWKELDFDHNRDSRFPLDGVHEKVECAKCHFTVTLEDGTEVVQYKRLGTECKDCHAIVTR